MALGSFIRMFTGEDAPKGIEEIVSGGNSEVDKAIDMATSFGVGGITVSKDVARELFRRNLLKDKMSVGNKLKLLDIMEAPVPKAKSVDPLYGTGVKMLDIK